MRMEIAEIMARALVDEVGLEKTLLILDRAQAKDAIRHPRKRNPDFIGMEGYAKIYAEIKCICPAGHGPILACPMHGSKL